MRFQIRIFCSCLLFILFLPQASYASVYFEKQSSLLDIEEIEHPEKTRTYYAELKGFPHTYQIVADEQFTLSLQVFVPDVTSSKNNISGVVIREIGDTGRVEDVGVLEAKNASWESNFEFWSGERKRIGPSLERNLEPGTYRIEIHTPDNIEKYILTLGSKEDLQNMGYIETIRTLASLKLFSEKSQWRIVESPYVYMPLIFLALLCTAFVWYRKRQKHAVY